MLSKFKIQRSRFPSIDSHMLIFIRKTILSRSKYTKMQPVIHKRCLMITQHDFNLLRMAATQALDVKPDKSILLLAFEFYGFSLPGCFQIVIVLRMCFHFANYPFLQFINFQFKLDTFIFSFILPNGFFLFLRFLLKIICKFCRLVI